MNYLYAVLLLCSINLSAQDSNAFFDKADDFFNQNIENGRVNYAEIKKNPSELRELSNMAKREKPSVKDSDNFKAFWINAYNLAVINGIVKNYPVKSPLEINGFFDTKQHSLGQQSLSLDEIEKEILFKNFPEEARFHFVLVCAAKSCPPIISEAYRPEKLEKQLEAQTKKALNDPNFIRLNKDKVQLSQIFKWYKKDFLKNENNLLDFINLYREQPIPKDFKTAFYDYNWQLNDLN